MFLLTITTLKVYSAVDKLMIFFLFFPENRIGEMEIVCMKCQILLSGKKNKHLKMSSAENFTQNAKR